MIASVFARTLRMAQSKGPNAGVETLGSDTGLAETVFVSSRTEELWLERNSVYEAIGLAGKIPIMLDTALNKLTDGAFPRGTAESDDRRFSGKRSLRTQVDALVDSADFFVGVYGTLAGIPDYSIRWLTWIEYELLRFLTRILCIRRVKDYAGYQTGPIRLEPWRPLTPKQREKLNDKMRDAEHIAYLRRILMGTPVKKEKGEIEQVHSLLDQRCLFYFKKSPGARTQLSYDLQEFLLPLRPYLREVRTTVLSTARPGDHHFFPAHAQLFEELYRELRAREPAHVMPRKNAASIRIELLRRPKRNHGPGVLYPLLRELFQAGFTIKQLFVGGRYVKTPAKTQPGIYCQALAFRGVPIQGARLREVRRELRTALSRELAPVRHMIKPPKIEVSGKPYDPMGPARPVHSRKGSVNPIRAYTILAINLPGILWSVATLIAAYGGSIVYLNFDDRRRASYGGWMLGEENGGVEFDVAFRIDAKVVKKVGAASKPGIDDYHANIRTFEHQLKVLHGIISVNPIAAERAKPVRGAR